VLAPEGEIRSGLRSRKIQFAPLSKPIHGEKNPPGRPIRPGIQESIMKIGPLESKPTVAPVQNDRKSGSTEKSAGGGSAAEPSATVQISSAAALISSADTDGTFDAEKVQRMAQAIRDGKFEVNADKIADKLIANTQELLRKYSSEFERRDRPGQADAAPRNPPNPAARPGRAAGSVSPWPDPTAPC
jgi:negative regulator of flagellin synthesis FlgM